VLITGVEFGFQSSPVADLYFDLRLCRILTSESTVDLSALALFKSLTLFPCSTISSFILVTTLLLDSYKVVLIY
jgi:hypothetical protein